MKPASRNRGRGKRDRRMPMGGFDRGVAGAFGRSAPPMPPALRDNPDAARAWLLEILAGEYSYDELLQISGNMRRDVERMSEITSMFVALSVAHHIWDRVADCAFQKKVVDHHRYLRDKTKPVAKRPCALCERVFMVNVTAPLQRYCSRTCGASDTLVMIEGVALPLTVWAERHGVAYKTVWMRLKDGWPLERALRPVGAGVPRNNSTGFRGVYHHKQSGKWSARVSRNGVVTHLGLFATRALAAEARAQHLAELAERAQAAA